ncbi:methylated-DNA--[protein]-cysteine S-methyltransferase [Listeria sp. FSL L7-1485]|uniref:methylated-DNA--[protein]-cysteine S-methyltransferase n=1 Tax=Listeria immobilis TaxID=2713502 RepID=A0A7X1C9D9_9LIST|nr:methylated-DNA--[protein]-cysteine S-methyltransferase [Listeria immobilis]MBC1483096.1 methylated-DNA--[protein]-cysteine S-methyltransferase [Listeria immobilis]MBC1489080.1 methylated-DNA--[protein]-cysteine S-methyltransferase [Listeria immobilis]MBC1507104.1 methylated-DNA--[protein]-cysteine S-methyltransferase [Listeria immobilis]MBC1509536.1 methylated-DNA--[protein]-cysteine S-methyltransferase [Listeria immobilis]MBC1515658.1 methylated-DNA--[protein]-cysteine S-methyltransferase 
MEKRYYDSMLFMDVELYLVATDKGIIYVGTDKKWLADAVFNSNKLTKYKDALVAYGNKELKVFDFPIELTGSELQIAVYKALKTIPYGETRTYTEIAEQINRPKAVRAIGTAIGKNPLLLIIPCHRVIGKNGKLTGYSGGLLMKEALLMLEK